MTIRPMVSAEYSFHHLKLQAFSLLATSSPRLVSGAALMTVFCLQLDDEHREAFS